MNSRQPPILFAPKVSVLIPVYNGERHLSECLESVLAQDYNDVEVLIADDGSSDGSQKIIEQFAARAPRIRWWKNPRNLGLTANANVCLRAAKGEFIKFVHQDDALLSPSALHKMVSVLDENPAVVLVSSQPHLTGTKSQPLFFSKKSGRYDGKKTIIACFEKNNNLIGQPTLTLFRKSAAPRGFNERFTGHMDFEMWCHLLEQGDFFTSPNRSRPGASIKTIKLPALTAWLTGKPCCSWKFITKNSGCAPPPPTACFLRKFIICGKNMASPPPA